MRNSRRCIVTGGCGFIGSALVRHLCREGRDVLVVDKLTYAGNVESLREVEGKYKLLVKDICDQEAMDAAFAEFKPDTIFHLAAESHVDRSIDGPGEFVRTNVVSGEQFTPSWNVILPLFASTVPPSPLTVQALNIHWSPVVSL